MGSFSQVVAGTSLEPWHDRTVEAIAELLMNDAAAHLTTRLRSFVDHR